MTFSTDDETIALGRTCWGALEPLHVIGYFAPETTRAYVDLGLHPRLAYFAARSAAIGAVGPEVTTATFYVFAPWLAAKVLPAAWDIATPREVQDARRRGVAKDLATILGAPDVREALELARTVCEGLTTPGRPLYAAHRALDWPADDLLALWHAATLIREHRGDGHIAILQSTGLDPVESLILGGLYGRNTAFVKSTRGWTEPQWADGEARLRERGLLDADGDLSDAGRTLRQQVEDRTDLLAAGGWAHLGAEKSRRLYDLVSPLRDQVLASGVLPDWISQHG